MKIVKSPGILMDALFLHILHFNPSCWGYFCNSERNGQDEGYYQSVLQKLSYWDEDLLPFFKLNEEKNSFLSSIIYFEAAEEVFETDSLEPFYRQFERAGTTICVKLVAFHLNRSYMEIERLMHSSHDVVKQILNCSLEERVKQRLILILLKPEEYLKKLLNSLKTAASITEKLYQEKEEEIIQFATNLRIEDIEKSIQKTGEPEVHLPRHNLLLSVPILEVNRMWYAVRKEQTYLQCGINWLEYSEFLARSRTKVDLVLLGKILSEQNRLKIIHLLAENGELYTGQIAEKLGISVAGMCYHLAMMADCKMLHVRTEGRAIYYSLNPEFFNLAAGEILRLISAI